VDRNHFVAETNLNNLSLNSYPGRGLIVGRSQDGNYLVQVYWIMGRSENSRNRVFSVNSRNGTLFTQAADPAKVTDPSLIIYRAMREGGGQYVVSNGDQTDTVMNMRFPDIHVPVLHLALAEREYEPDPPNFTPRITGRCVLPGRWMLDVDAPLIELAVLKKSPFGGDVGKCDRFFYDYTIVGHGYGYGLTTYTGNGDPLPAWKGEPLLFPLEGSIQDIAATYHTALNEENFVSLAVKFISVFSGHSSIHIINKYKKI
jgi:IMP cyclohydrolase